jgi:hypothetical protein
MIGRTNNFSKRHSADLLVGYACHISKPACLLMKHVLKSIKDCDFSNRFLYLLRILVDYTTFKCVSCQNDSRICKNLKELNKGF